jgi:rhodanese-related sulfurtransferase
MHHPINSHELFTRLRNGEILNLPDVREEIEYLTFNIGAGNMPLSKFTENLSRISYNKTDKIVVMCKAGLNSETARLVQLENGYLRVWNLSGGLISLQKLK